MTALRREHLVGVWDLLGHEIQFAGAAQREAPFGPQPKGVLTYTAAGHVSVHMMDPARPKSGADSASMSGSAAQTAMATHLSYCGLWRFSEGTVSHDILICSLQDMVGTTLRRRVERHDSHILLWVDQMSFADRPVSAVLEWRPAAPL